MRRDMPDDDIRKGVGARRPHPAHRSHRRARRLRRRARRRCCASTCASRAWARRRRAASATSWRCARRARERGIPVPGVRRTCSTTSASPSSTERVPPPWVLKPRSQAAAIGIKKIARAATSCGARSRRSATERSNYVLEQFVPGRRLSTSTRSSSTARRCSPWRSRYGTPPMAVAHEGGIFVTRTLPDDDRRRRAAAGDERARAGRRSGCVRGVSHTEFIRADDGELYFLETSARVGGAFIVDVIEAATGINLWREWAKVEIAGETAPTSCRPPRPATPASSCRWRGRSSPDMRRLHRPRRSSRRIRKQHHAGLIVASPTPGARVGAARRLRRALLRRLPRLRAAAGRPVE